MRHKGVLEGFELSRKDVEDMIMAARIAAGWVTQEDLARCAPSRPPRRLRPRPRRRGAGRRLPPPGVSGHGGSERPEAMARTTARRRADAAGQRPLRLCAVSRVAGRLRSSSASSPVPMAIVPDLCTRVCRVAACGSRRRGSAVPEAVRRKVFARSLKRPSRCRPTSPTFVERLLAEASGPRQLSIANKAGLLVARLCQGRGADSRGAAPCHA